jgi:hypothetical protein
MPARVVCQTVVKVSKTVGDRKARGFESHPLRWLALPGYSAADRIDRGEEDVAESHSRVRSWATVAAFTLIVALTVAEGVDEGFNLWDWLVIAVGAAFIVQALVRLDKGRSAST